MCFYSSMSAADEQQYISVSFLSPLRWHIMLGALRTSNMTASSFLGSLSRIYKICSKKVEWAIEFPSKYRRTFHIWGSSFEAAAVWYTKNRSCTKRVHQVSLLLPLSSISDWLSLSVLGSVPTHFPSFYPFFRPFSLHIDPHWESKPHVTLSKCFLNVFWNPSTSIKSYPEKNDPESSGSVE